MAQSLHEYQLPYLDPVASASDGIRNVPIEASCGQCRSESLEVLFDNLYLMLYIYMCRDFYHACMHDLFSFFKYSANSSQETSVGKGQGRAWAREQASILFPPRSGVEREASPD